MNAMLKSLAAVAVVGVAALPVATTAQEIHAKCDGFQVVSSQSTGGSATFRAKVDRVNKTIEYVLNYTNLEGDIIQSHIHFSRPGSNGGIVLFLCTNAGNTPASATPAPLCPGTREGTVTGTLHAGDVVYIPFGNQFPPPPAGTQGISPGDFDAVVRFIDAGAGYVVVHTKAQPTGELRGQIPDRDDHDHDGNQH
ncbi:MAG TPA: CHRD domain-containing protein [Candidatus Angelobacter sp.]|nr:CHRD domain-containing protein [Candidatus Angelobacter sp.]